MENRRSFIKTMAGATAGIMIPWGNVHWRKKIESDKFGELLPLRRLGKTGKDVTMLGLEDTMSDGPLKKMHRL